MANDVSAERAARNQALFREINARLVDTITGLGAQTERHDFICECAHLRCTKPIALTLAEYEAVRRDPRRFFVGPSQEHFFPEAEDLVEAHTHYYVVEKKGVAAKIAEAHASG